MSKLLDKLREKGVFNSYYFYGNEPYLYLRIKGGRRDVIPSAWQVHKRDQKLSDAWYSYGAKSFSYSGRESKKQSLEEAKKWAAEKFGITEWTRDPFGGYGDATFVKRRLAELV